MKIYFMRHGESENNLNGRMTGWMDAPLTERGVEQARAASEKLRGIAFDKVFSSDLVRARLTCETVLPECEYTVDERLREINVGCFAGMTNAEIKEEFGDVLHDCYSTGDYSRFGGETRDEFWGRIRSFLADLEDKPYENVAVFAHAGLIRGVFNMLFGTACGGKIANPNCLVAVFELKDGDLTLIAWNI